MPDFSKHQIIWGGGHSLDRSELRDKPPEEVERVIRSSDYQQQGTKSNRWEMHGCIGGYLTKVIVAEIGQNELVVVTVFGEDIPCK